MKSIGPSRYLYLVYLRLGWEPHKSQNQTPPGFELEDFDQYMGLLMAVNMALWIGQICTKRNITIGDPPGSHVCPYLLKMKLSIKYRGAIKTSHGLNYLAENLFCF